MDLDFRRYRVAGVPLLAGTLNGALAWVSGYLVSFVLYIVFGLQPFAEIAAVYGGFEPDLFTAVAFAFYGGQFVPVEDGSGSINYAFDLAANGALYTLLALTVLFAVGYYLASAEGLAGPRDRVLAGASVVLGYAPLAILGTFVFEHEYGSPSGGSGETATMELPLVRTVLLAGLLFPIVVGSLGGLFASYRNR